MGIPKITFGIIVLNGEPFTRYNLRALYPFAHEIIVAEGASPKAAHAATPDGHSIGRPAFGPESIGHLVGSHNLCVS